MNQIVGDIKNNRYLANVNVNKTSEGNKNIRHPSYFIILIIANILSMGCNFLFIFQEYPRIDLSFDYLGFIIGLLSFLLAALAVMFGYHIFDMKDRVKEYVSNETLDIRAKINRLEEDISYLKDKIVVKKIYVKGNIIIKSSNFEYHDLVAYAKESHSLNATIIDGDLIIDDSYSYAPNTDYYAEGEIYSV